MAGKSEKQDVFLYQIHLGKYQVRTENFGVIKAYEIVPVRICEICQTIMWDKMGTCECKRNAWQHERGTNIFQCEYSFAEIKKLITELKKLGVSYKLYQFSLVEEYEHKIEEEEKPFTFAGRINIPKKAEVEAEVGSEEKE
jgi:hypothetical protein